MEAVQTKEIDCIVVKDLSRLGRNYIETGEFLEKICPFFGIRFIAINDGFDTDTVEASGQLSVSLSNIINDYYAKDISRKVSSALRSKMENGDFIGAWEKYGYIKDPNNKNQLIINPETAPVVKQIFLWRSEGMSYMGINKKLNDSGILSPGQYKANRGIVTNNNQTKQRNGGYITCCTYGYKVSPKNKHQMIIDPETAPIVRRIFTDVIAGKSTSQVARELNTEGIPTPQQYKGVARRKDSPSKALWTHNRILDMLKNIKYTGSAIQDGQSPFQCSHCQQRFLPVADTDDCLHTH